MGFIYILVLLMLFATPFAQSREQSNPADRSVDAATLQQAIEKAYKEGLGKYTLAPGTYRLQAVHGGRDCLNFNHMQNFEIDGTGAMLIATTPNTGLLRFDQCQNVTVRGITFTHDPVPFSEGSIQAIEDNGKSLIIRVAYGYPPNPNDSQAFPKNSNVKVFDSDTRERKYDRYADIGVKSIQSIGPDLFKFQLTHGIAPTSSVRAGDLVAWRGKQIGDIYIGDSSDMKLIGVTVVSGSGLCFHECGGDGGNRYESCTVTRGPRPSKALKDPLFASNADAFHSTNVRHGPTLEGCRFEWMDDDGIAIHGTYALLVEAIGDSIIANYPMDSELCRPGDTIHFLDERRATVGEARVKSVNKRPDYQPTMVVPNSPSHFKKLDTAKYYEMVLDREIPVQSGWMLCNANATGSGFTIRNCIIRGNRARGMMIKGSDGLIEGCTVEGCTQSGIGIWPEIEGSWCDGDYAHNVIVRNNLIRNVHPGHYPGNPFAGAITVSAFEQNRYVPLPGGHRNITIENNTFQSNNGINLLVSSAENVNITGNRFVQPSFQIASISEHLTAPTDVLLYFTECKNIVLSNNSVIAPGANLRRLVETEGAVEGAKGLHGGIDLESPVK
jgi:Right handed beta helix region